MFRRSLLVAATATLAGCGLAPAPPSTDGFPETLPNAFFAFAWDDAASAYEVSFVRGNRLTADNTGSLTVRVTTDETESSALWVGEDPRDDDGQSEPRASLPLAPEATVRIPPEGRGDVRVIWTAPDGSRSRLVGMWPREEQPGVATEEA